MDGLPDEMRADDLAARDRRDRILVQVRAARSGPPPEGQARPLTGYEQTLDWSVHNCCGCARTTDGASPCCEIAEALVAAVRDGDGSVDAGLAARMGYVAGPPYAHVWDCPERELKKGESDGQ